MSEHDSIRADVAAYFGAKVREHGARPQGVDWNGDTAQLVRFDQLLRLCDGSVPLTLNDYGCGYGRLLEYVGGLGWQVDYRGYDVSEDMVAQARRVHGEGPGRSFTSDPAQLEPADFSVASGLFNIRVGRSDEEWLDFIETTLDELDRLSTRGFAFNALTGYSDPEHMRPDLYYADPCALFDRCKRRYSRQVALLHDYGIYDFTILVRKDGA